MIAAGPDRRRPAVQVRRLVIANQDCLRAGALRGICGAAFPGVEITVYGMARDTLQALEAEPVDLVITGLRFPDADGLEVLDGFRRRSRLLFVVSERTDDWVMLALRNSGFNGFFDPTTDDFARLGQALPRVAAGDIYYSLNVKEHLLARKFSSVLTERLTATELKVLRAIADGSTDAEAAERLGMSEQTVKTHRREIIRKLDVLSSAKLVREALRLGIR